jgi:4-amino-4-deoxy-L-arabinose transferase-like glycosyltransferase
MLNDFRRWFAVHPKWTLTIVTVITLAPFLAKPFNMDDPLFIWAAHQIQAHPENPYDFNVNWYGMMQPMWTVTENPPLMCYYLALAAGIFGWSEFGLHFACLLPAVAVVLGTYRLAKNFCRWPQFAALVTLFAPGFLVSATTVMCDVFMLAFWIWAVVFWTEGVKQNNCWKLSTAGTLMALALLTKYYGVCLIPLLAVYGWLESRAVVRWAVFLLIPLAALYAYECLTFHLYGQMLFSAAVHYAKSAQTMYEISRFAAAFNSLTFTGGCFAAALFCALFFYPKKTLLIFTVGSALLAMLALGGGMMAKNYSWLAGNIRISTEIQMFFWSMGGVCVLALALAEGWQKPDPSSWLLAFWVLGTFIFTGFVNWTVNARSLLPMAPVVAILIVRRLEQNRTKLPGGIKISLAASALLSLLAAQSDFQLANAIRQNANQACTKYAAIPGTLWFQGHWGFQYYMQTFGALMLDDKHILRSGDVLIIPSENTNLLPPDPQATEEIDSFSASISPWIAIWSPAVGAGFYASIGGPLPFAFGGGPPDRLFVYILKQPVETKH